jgi:hypothetical protein
MTAAESITAALHPGQLPPALQAPINITIAGN